MKTLHTIYSTFAKHNMAKFLTIFTILFTIGVGQMWADYTVEFKTGSGSEVTTKTAIINSGGDYVSSVSASKTYAESDGLRYGSTDVMGYTTFTLASNGQVNASKIIFNDAKYYSSDASSISYTIKYTDNSTKTGTITLSTSATDYEVTLESTKKIKSIDIRKTAASKKRFYLKGFKIVTAASYTVNWTINPAAGGTLSATTGNSITVTPNAAYTYGSPAYTVTSGFATVSQSGNTFTATPTANSTIQINMVEKPKYTVTLKDDNSTLIQSTAGGSVTLPTRDGCDGYTFAGWTSTWTSEQSTWTTTAPTIITAGSYTPTANEDLFPVYTKTEGGGNTTTQIVDQLTHSINGKAATNTTYTSFSNKTFTSDAVYAGSTANGNNNEAEGVIQIRSSSSNTGIITTTSGGLAKKIVVEWHSFTSSGRTLDVYGKKSAYSSVSDLYDTSKQGTKIGSIVNGTSTELTISDDYEYIGLRSNSNAMYFTSIAITWETTSGGGSTTSYISVPNCCTQLAEVTGLQFSNITSNSITVSVPSTYSDKANASGYTFNCYSALTGGSPVATADENGTSYTFTGLTKNTTYYFTVIAKGEDKYCNSIETSPRESSKTLTQYTITLNPNGGTGTFTGWTANGSNYTMTVDAGTQITLPELSKTGYDFADWNDGTTTVTSPYTPTKTVTLTAQWTAQKYGITYKDQGEATFSGTHEIGYPTQHTYGTETTLKGATKTGYTFDGWFKEAACTNKVTTLGATEYTGNITLYAKWTEKALVNYRTDCDVDIKCDAYSFHTGDGTIANMQLEENITCFEEHGVAQGGLEHEWQIADYTIPEAEKFFVGYYGYFYNDNLGIGDTDGDKSRSVVSDWTNMYLAPSMTSDDPEHSPRLGHAKGAVGTLRIFEDSDWDNLFVGFIPDGYTVKFGTNEYPLAVADANTHDYRTEILQYEPTNYANAVSAGVIDAAGKYIATANTQEMRHIFLKVPSNSNWAKDNAKFSVYDIGASAFKNGFMTLVPGSTELYEGWVDKDCANIIFVRHNATADYPSWDNKWNQTGDLSLQANQNMFTITADTGDGLGDAGWANGTYTKYGKFRMYEDSKAINWYLHFYPYHALTYDKNAADATDTMDMAFIEADAANKHVLLEYCGFTRPGYEFDKWRKGTTSTYYAPNGSNTIELTDDITLYAIWKAKKITITWDANGGSVDPTKSTYTYNGTPVELPTPTRANYIFNGWFTAASGGTKIEDVGTTNKPTDDVTYYAQWKEKEVPTFAWSATSYTAALEADNTFPTLNNPDGLSPITYTSSNTGVATIDANGNITLVATGTTTITATGAESATHKSATDTYELIVVAANCKWVETDIANINSGDEVVITMSKGEFTWTISNEKNTSTAPTANEITANIQGKYLTTVSDEYKWVIEKDNANLTFYSYSDNANYLYCTNADNGVRVGTGDAKVFVVDGNYLKNTQTTSLRYVGISFNTNPYSWRCYTVTTGVIKDETLKFYKKVCLDSEHYWVTWDANGGQWSDGSTKKEEIYTVGATITKPADPTRDGYQFAGWNPNPTTMPAANTTFTAKWTKEYIITWKVGSTTVLTETVTTGVTKIPTDDPADNAIGDCADTFMGWSEKSAGSTHQDAAYYDDLCTAADMKSKHSNVTGNKTFYAVFATSKETTGGTVEASLSFASTAQRDSQTSSKQVWSNEGITFTNNQGSSTSAVADYSNPVRLYKNSEIIVEHTSGEITKIVFGCNSSAYATALKNSIGTPNSNTTVTASSDKVTVTFANAVASFSARLTSDQVRLDALTVTAGGGTITTYSNYVTNCCELLPVTNLQVSGVTEKSATLTWTAPSPTTGITKLQVRNAETDAIVVDNIAVNTTTATITGLTECTSYQYYVVSVGDCEVVSNIVTATPFSGAKTVNYDYNGGTGSPASFTTNCNNQTITLPVATRTGYTFNGWYTAATGGTRVGDANDTYEPATSPVTLYAQWTINQYTVTWNPNGGNWNGSTVNIVQTYEYGAAINKPADPTRENGIFKGWTPNPELTMPASDKTYTAQWDMVYTLTFVDMNIGGTTSTLTQASSGQNIVAPTANSEVCDMWTFIGWAPSNSLNGGTDKPADFIAAGETILGSQITENKTYYSVYSYNSDNTQEFEVGKSGTYLMYAISGTTKYYATTVTSSENTFYKNQEEDFATYGYPSTFTLTYNSASKKYKIYHENTTEGKNSKGYLYQSNATDKEINVKSETSYTEFTISEGTAEGSFVISFPRTGDDDAYFGGSSSSNFSGKESSYDIYFEPASEIQYYNAANCGEVQTYTMSFHNPFGDENALIWYDAEHEDSYYTDKPLNTLIDVFPTMVYNGWAFIGWTANQQYNELIGDENLDDENSATNDPASSLTIYSNTAGWSYQLNSNVTMYPVFTKYEDNEDIDLGSGGEYYMYFYREDDYYKDDYFGADSHYQRMYALAGGGDNGEFGYTTNCNNAQIFEFIKEGDGWNIRVKNADGTYPTKSYLVNTSGNDYDLVATKPSSTWSITKEAEGDFTMWYRGNTANSESDVYYQAKAREYSGGTSWDFKCYNQDNDASQYYYKVYLGTCENRVFSSNPTNKPAITLSGEPIVTSTQDQSIRAQGELSISATKLAANGTITLTSDNADVYFSTVKDANFTQATKPLASLTLNADEKGKLAMTTVYVHYKPTSTSSLGVQTATITATTGTEGEEDYATAETTAHVRNLPTNFVIAAKWGDNWYAMPADMNSQSSTDGWLIEVDDAANPTKAIAAPNTTKYGLKSVYTSNSTADRYADNGERLVFVENVEETTPVTNKTLYNGGDASGSKTNIQVYAQYANYYSDQNQAPRYEWIPTTTDLTDYTLTSGAILTGDAVGRTVSLDNHGVFGTLLQDKSYNGMVRLLPVDDFYGPAELQVVEWKQNSVSVMYTGAGTKYTTKVGNNVESSVQPLSKIDHAVYSLSTADLTTATNQPLIIYIKNDANATIGSIKLTIPAIVATDKSSTALGVAEENAKATSIVVLDGATLTADATKYTYDDITVYPGGNLVIDNGKALGMYTLTLRAGSSWGAAKYEHKYPQFLLKGDYSNSSGQINLDYVTTKDYYYPLSVPEEVTIGDIKYPVDIYGSNVEKANKGSFRLKYYDGAQRVAQGSQYGTGWVVVNEDETKTLTPNQGYAIWGIPKKINGTRQTYGIHRIPMKIAAGTLATNEKTNAVVQVTAHGINDANVLPNDKGWNYLGNPYLAQLGGMDGDDEKLQMGRLIQEMIDGKWTGGWVYNNEQVRYITITNDCQNFDPLPVAEAQIPAFTTFFIQAAQDGAISLTAPANVVPASIAARHYAAQQQAAKEITTGIILTGNDQTDRTGLLIADNFTEEYDFNADLSKFENSGINLYTIGKDGKLAFMAINQALAEQPIPLGYGAPTDGEYTIAFDEDRYNATDISALYLIDYDRNEKTNLLHTDYSFVTAAGTNNERFALQVAFIPQNATSVEWVDDATIQVAVDGNNLLLNNLPTDAGVQVFDALGRVIYATPNAPTEMQITLPTGYYLVRIADKQHAVVINTVIP